MAVYDRPWNRQVEFPDDRFVRCLDWTEIDHVFEQALFVLKEMRNQCAYLELITRFKLKSRRTVLNRFNDIREMSGLARGDLSYLDVLKILNTFVQISDIKRQIFFFYLNMSFKGRKKIADKALSKMGRKKLSVWMKL